MNQFENKSLNLVLLQIVGPVLIMLMVSSLVFFLIEVVYRGPHTARMYWVMGLFTIASVLVARISIEEGKERALLFGVALAVATLITSMQLVEFRLLAILRPAVLIGLIGVVMWTSNKLTWDCTVVDKSRDVSSSGLWERLKRSWGDADEKRSGDKAVSKIWQMFVSGSKVNSPGTWVIYFAIIAFPVFGLGQWFVRPEASSWIYLLFALYFGSALGLLLTTSLLGLERYLAKRNVHIPAPIARSWMLVGGAFALAVMLLVSLVPKPGGSSTISDAFAALTSPLKNTSDWAQGKDGNEEKQDARNKKIDPRGEQLDKDGEQGEEPGNKTGDDGKAGQGKDAKESDDQQSNSGNQAEKSDQRDGQAGEDDSKPQRDHRQQGEPVRQQDQHQGNANRKDDGDQNDRQQRDDQRQQRPPPPQQQNQQSSDLTRQIFDEISKFVNWIVYLVGIIAALVLLFLFRNELINLFNLLMGRRNRSEPEVDETPVEEKRARPPIPFERFQNPFKSGEAQKSLHRLVDYSMLALEAWAREFGIERREDETPNEFARRLKSVDPQVARLAKTLGDLYNQCAFSGNSKLQADTRSIAELWQRMESTWRNRRNQPANIA